MKRTSLSGLEQNRGLSDRRDHDGPAENDKDEDKDKGDSTEEQGGLRKTESVPNRISFKINGLEWFIYNRTPAYDSILSGFGHAVQEENASSGGDSGSPPPGFAKSKTGQHVQEDLLDSLFNPHRTNSSSSKAFTNGGVPSTGPVGDNDSRGEESDLHNTQPPDDGRTGERLSKLLKLLPIELECNKGAIVLGNEHTTSVFATTFRSANGAIEVCASGPLDLYRQVLSFQFDHPVVQLRRNPDFKQNQLATANVLNSPKFGDTQQRHKRNSFFKFSLWKHGIWHNIRELVPSFRSSVESLHVYPSGERVSKPKPQATFAHDTRWVGLARYLDDSVQDAHEGWSTVEYGRFSTILDSPRIGAYYYWDIPGPVLPHHASTISPGSSSSTNINGAEPPEWGLDLRVEGGTIEYGPWADRERVGLQNIFFPNSYCDSQPAKPLAPGEPRQSTLFKLRVEFEQETVLRMPTREPSKDSQWKGRAEVIKDTSRLKQQQQQQQQQQRRQNRKKKGDKSSLAPDIRPFGWLSLRVARYSTASYTMDMVASESGYRNQLILDCLEPKVSSSVNHGLLWQSPRQLVTFDLPNPLRWNALRKWDFTVDSQDLELFLLRDHMFLISDLVSDWTTGPPSDYYTFVPAIYKINLVFTDLKLFINVNDLNIINNPIDLDDNRFLVIKAKDLTSNVTIPSDRYRPSQNAVDFSFDLHNGSIDALTPVWDTMHTFLQNNSVTSLSSAFIGGTYNYYAETAAELTDTLVLNVDLNSPNLYLFGFLIRSFMIVRENYFGENMHFKTLEEFQEESHTTEETAAHSATSTKKSNDLDVIVHVNVDKPRAFLPADIYSDRKSLHLNGESIEADLRFTNYYMDLQVSISPLKVSMGTQSQGSASVVSPTQLFIDGVSVHGHRLFGLPPTEPTYVCNWDFEIGSIIGECSAEFLSCLIRSIQNFDMTFDNHENALPSQQPVLNDVTFVRASIDLIHISIFLDQMVFILSSGLVKTNLNDWTDLQFSKRLDLSMLDLAIAVVDRRSVDEVREQDRKTLAPYALFQTAVELKMAQRRRDISEHRILQEEHVRVHDQPTGRVRWLLFDWHESTTEGGPIASQNKPDSQVKPIPSMPAPIRKQHSLRRHPSSIRYPSFRNNASTRSFLLHSDTSSIGSVRRPRASAITKSSSLKSKDTEGSPEREYSKSPQKTTDDSGGQQGSKLATLAGYSNPWAIPEFSMYKASLDTSQLPQQTANNEEPYKESTTLNPLVIRSPYENERTKQSNFYLHLISGIKGFCTPQFLLDMSTLVKDFQPVHPVEVIDSLQKDIISHIVGYEKAMKDPNQTTSVAVRVPLVLLKFVNTSESDTDSQANFRDEFNISVSHLMTEFRTRVTREKNDLVEGIKESFALHADAKSLSASVEGKRYDAPPGQAKLEFGLHDMNFWLSTTPDVKSHLQLRSFDTTTSTKSMEHLAFLVRRTTTTMDSVTSSFQYSAPRGDERLRALVYWLTLFSPNIPDPIFLTRVSSVLRVASSHVRQHDSWKIVSRLRNIYKHLQPTQRQQLEDKCVNDDLSLPNNARKTVVSIFDKWRTWELAHVEKSYAMQKIWQHPAPAPAQEENGSPPPPPSISLSTTVGSFRFSIDPGPNESDFRLLNASTAINIRPEKVTLQKGGEILKNVIIVRSYCADASLRLRWEVLDLAEGIFRTMSTVTLESTQHPKHSSVGQIGQQQQQATELHIVFGADVGGIVLDGINIKLNLIGKAMRGSVVNRSNIPETNDDLSVLCSSRSGFFELISHSKLLMAWRVSDPYVYGSKSSAERWGQIINDYRIAGSCRKLRYVMEEDPIGLTHTADRLIEYEVRHVRQLMKNMVKPAAAHHESEGEEKEQEQSAAAAAAAKKVIPTRNRFHVAFFLDDYKLKFNILPSLTYNISGYVSRMSLAPASANSSMIEVDFDLKENFHAFLSEAGENSEIYSTLKIPPINGRVMAKQTIDHIHIGVDTTVELIRLDASDLRGLLSIITGSEFSHMVSDVKQNFEVLQLHLDDALESNKSPTRLEVTEEKSRELLYQARLTMAGMAVHVTKPETNEKNNYSAGMNFGFGMTRMHINNGMEQGVPVAFPEFSVDISQILLELTKRERSRNQTYGRFSIDAKFLGTSQVSDNGERLRAYHLSSKGFSIELSPETASLAVDVASYMQERIKTTGFTHEVRRFRRLRRRTQSGSKAELSNAPLIKVNDSSEEQEDLFNAVFSLVLENVQVAWNMTTVQSTISGYRPEDLVFSIRRFDLSSKKKNTAKLRIEDARLQIVPPNTDRRKRSLNSALLPELVFNAAYLTSGKEVKLAFQAAGKSVDLRVKSDFMLPGSMLQESIYSASKVLREAKVVSLAKPSASSSSERKPSSSESSKQQQKGPFGNKRLRSVLVDVDFAGAIITLQGRHGDNQQATLTARMKASRISEARYGHYVHGDTSTTASLRTPGVALKVQFESKKNADPALNAELSIDASTNVVYPTVVPLIKEVTTSVKEVIGEGNQSPSSPPAEDSTKMQQHRRDSSPDNNTDTTHNVNSADTIIGKSKVNVGLRIRKQEFSLSCRPVAKVLATAKFDGAYVTANTVQSDEGGRFVGILASVHSLQASVKHVYSSESTASFNVESIVMSAMNSKHLVSVNGISTVLRLSPVTVALDAKQVQDLLLFREIWLPATENDSDSPPEATTFHQPAEDQAYVMQRYQQVASAPAFPWNATIAVEKFEIQLDLGSTLGKTALGIHDVWVSSKKTSDWEQTLCVNFGTVGVESKGRTSGTIELKELKARTSIQWPAETRDSDHTPLIQASIQFDLLQAKMSFDYQPFLVVDIANFDFIMYNVQGISGSGKERLFSIVDGEKVFVYCTTLTASQSIALFQAWQRLARDKQTAYEASLKEVERFMRRRSSTATSRSEQLSKAASSDGGGEGEGEDAKMGDKVEKAPISLQTTVVVRIKAIDAGVFPSTFFDSQILKLEASNAQARFAVTLEENKIHSALGLTLGHLGVALSGTIHATNTNLEELSVNDVVHRATHARGGTILKVPRLIASMQTWQSPGSSQIDYVFTSSFEGKVDVGWNYSRIRFIRGMWEGHSRALASRLGKPLQPLAVRITSGSGGVTSPSEEQPPPTSATATAEEEKKDQHQEKITAVVDVPQSRYTYTALTPPVIETPQLRDMGEATPPLEWIGLQREKLPNVTHQMIIVTLLEVAREVEDAYERILGAF